MGFVYLVVRCKGDRHRSHPGAHQRPETWTGSHQGTMTLSVSLCFQCKLQPYPNCFLFVYFPLPFSLPSCPPPLNPALSDQDQFEFALTAVAEEVNAILKALPQWAALVWTHSCDANTYVWKITVNKKLLHHTGSSYCSCFQHAVFHRLLILWVEYFGT